LNGAGPGQPTTPERLARHGIGSIAILGFHAPEVASGSGRVVLPDATAPTWTAARTTDEALAAIRVVSGPQYLWVHYYDVHEPRVIAPDAPPAPAGLVPEAYYRALWSVDREVGRLVEGVAGLGRRAAILITADHGEGLGEHGLEHHGLFAFEETIRVPMLLVAPGLPSHVYDGLVSHRDVPATVLGAFARAAAEPSVETFGASLLRLRAAPAGPLRLFAPIRSNRATTLAGWALPQLAIVGPRWKLVRTFGQDVLELYDLAADPGELRDLGERHGERARLEGELDTFRDLDAFP